MLLEAGADPNIYLENHNKKLVHFVYMTKKGGLETYSAEQGIHFSKLVAAQ
jgi:hypothetical protein